MRILFWVPYSTEGPSNRYRIEQYLPYLRKNKIEYTLHPFWTRMAYALLYNEGQNFKKICFFILGTFSRLVDLLLLFKYDIVFIHREAYPLGGAFFETILWLLHKPFIFDFDDAIFLPSSSKSNSFISRFKSPLKTAGIIKMSSVVIAGNSYLAKFALRHNLKTVVIPTVVDIDLYIPLVKKRGGEEVVIGWIGTKTTSNFLYLLENVFKVISSRFRHVRFVMVGGDFITAKKLNMIHRPWALNYEKQYLQSFDIGIMPMVDNEWTRGKCAFKAILYMSMALPCVCSAVGMNKEIISDGKNGFLVNSDNNWIEKLSLLITNSSLREKIGIEARKTIEEKYSTKSTIARYLGVIDAASETVSRKTITQKKF